MMASLNIPSPEKVTEGELRKVEGSLVDILGSGRGRRASGKASHRGHGGHRGGMRLEAEGSLVDSLASGRRRRASGESVAQRPQRRIRTPFWSSIALESIARRCEQNMGWKPYATLRRRVATSVHGDSSLCEIARQSGNQCSIGFQPVFIHEWHTSPQP
jgi:hypothetical protein